MSPLPLLLRPDFQVGNFGEEEWTPEGMREVRALADRGSQAFPDIYFSATKNLFFWERTQQPRPPFSSLLNARRSRSHRRTVTHRS